MEQNNFNIEIKLEDIVSKSEEAFITEEIIIKNELRIGDPEIIPLPEIQNDLIPKTRKKRNSRKSANKVRGKNYWLIHYQKSPSPPDSKLSYYSCKYCRKRFAENVTRMKIHLRKCPNCPSKVKQALQDQMTKKVEQELKKKMLDKNQCWAQFKRVVAPPQATLPHYKCIHCNKHFAQNITRMREHLEKCRNFPDDIKETLHVRIPEEEIAETDEEKHLKLLFAKAVYSSGVPFTTFTQNDLWKQFFSRMQSSFSIPSMERLSTTLMDKVYNSVNKDVNQKIAKADTVVISCYGSINVKQQRVINFILLTPKPVFFKSVTSVEHEQIENDFTISISNIIQSVGIKKCIAVCTSMESNIVKTWSILEAQYHNDGVIFYGCLRNTLDLLLFDLLGHANSNRIFKSCTNIVKEIKMREGVNAAFTEIQKGYSKKNQSTRLNLKLPVKSNWASSLTCLDSILANKKNLQALTEYKINLNTVIKKMIEDDIFWIEIRKLADLIRPIVTYINKIEENSSTLSIVPQLFRNLEDHFNTVFESSLNVLNPRECVNFKTTFEARTKTALRPIHFAASILDPHCKGQDLNPEQFAQGSIIISQITQKLNFDTNLITQQLADYIDNDGFWGEDSVQSALGLLSVHLWWKLTCKTMKLSVVAELILNLPLMSARTYHAKLTNAVNENGITAKRAAKINYISSNLRFDDPNYTIENQECLKNDGDVFLSNKEMFENVAFCSEDFDLIGNVIYEEDEKYVDQFGDK